MSKWAFLCQIKMNRSVNPGVTNQLLMCGYTCLFILLFTCRIGRLMGVLRAAGFYLYTPVWDKWAYCGICPQQDSSLVHRLWSLSYLHTDSCGCTFELTHFLHAPTHSCHKLEVPGLLLGDSSEQRNCLLSWLTFVLEEGRQSQTHMPPGRQQ